MTRYFDFVWRKEVHEDLQKGAVFDRWFEVRHSRELLGILALLRVPINSKINVTPKSFFFLAHFEATVDFSRSVFTFPE